MTLIAIIVATLVAGVGSVWLAALLMRLGVLAENSDPHSTRVGSQHLLSLAAGALLATAFMHLLPEAFESQASAKELFACLLVGLIFFFLLDKAELWHHGHEHSHPGDHAHHHPSPDQTQARAGHHHGHSHTPPGGWAVLTGDSVHCFGDGILIASAFMADLQLGVVAALAVLAHEVPHHMGDLVVLRQTSNKRMALFKVSLAGAVTALGGITGWALVGRLGDWLPYFLVVASSSFVYVALADLIPQLQKRLSARQTVAQIIWLTIGIVLVTLVSGLAHAH
jgi:zinc and cadmium transporter